MPSTSLTIRSSLSASIVAVCVPSIQYAITRLRYKAVRCTLYGCTPYPVPARVRSMRDARVYHVFVYTVHVPYESTVSVHGRDAGVQSERARERFESINKRTRSTQPDSRHTTRDVPPRRLPSCEGERSKTVRPPSLSLRRVDLGWVLLPGLEAGFWEGRAES